uniref:Cytochrome P450 n=1 Tax=Oryza punctata TaxID=4537 RepID=A0A0E0LRP3_ORYPU
MERSSELSSWLPWAAAALAVSLLYLLAVGWRRRSTAAAGCRRRLPPGPPSLPLIGNLLSLRGVFFHHTLASLARRHGPVMMLKLGLTTTVVVVSSRDAASEAFTKHDRRLAARPVPDALRAVGFSDRSMIFLVSSDERWKAMRFIHATHVLSPGGLAAARAVRERKVRDIVDYLRRRAGTEVDVGHTVYGGMLNVLSGAFFSADVFDMGGEPVRGGLPELLHEIVEVVTKPNVSDLVPLLRRLDLQGMRRATARRFERVFHILDGIIDRRSADDKVKHGDYLDSLLGLVSTGKISRDTVTIMLFEVFAAGSDMMTVSVVWAMAELLRNPAAMAKVRAEMEHVLGGKEEDIDEDDAARLPYLEAAWRESMRLHPVGPLLLPHLAAEDGVVIGGYAVPRGSTVLFNACRTVGIGNTAARVRVAAAQRACRPRSWTWPRGS